MMKHVALLTAMVVLVTVTEGATTEETTETGLTPEAARSSMVTAVNAFSANLYKRAGRASEGNVVLSPLSAGLLLALTWEGAAGATAQELSRALHLPQDKQLVAAGSKALVSSLQSRPGQTVPLLGSGDASPPSQPGREIILRLANKVYAQRGFRLKEDFRQKASSFFGAETEELDFAQDSEGARSSINSWVEDYTASKIKELFGKGSPSSSSLLVLVNAVYLKAIWLKPFDRNRTEMSSFHVSSRDVVSVPTMRKYSEYRFANISELRATALQLAVEDGRGLKMVIVLPDSVDGLPQLEANLEHLDVNAIPWVKRTVNVSLPRFHIEATHNLDVQLQELGVNDLFTKNANLSGIADEGLYVSKAVQKTFIDVNENGIEAAAATGMDFVYFSIPPPRADFHANHPFLFFIIKEDAILFLGRVTDPRQK